MKVCVVGSGGREHALAAVLGRTARWSSRRATRASPARSPRRPTEIDADLFVIGPEAPLVDGLADRLRAAGPAGVRARRRRRPARGLEGVDEGAARRGRRADRPARHLHRGRARPRLPRHPRPASTWSRPTASPPARACSSPTSLAEARDAVAEYLSGAAFGDAGRTRRDRGGPHRPRGLGARRVRRPRGRSPSPRPRTSSGSATATPGPTPAAWAPTRRCRSPAPTSCAMVMDDAVEPDARRAARRGASTTGACSTPGSCSPPTARRCSSTTCASATPRPRSCCPASPPTSPSCSPARPPASLGDDADLRRRRRGHRGVRRRGLPPRAAHRRRIEGLDAARAVDGRHRLLRRRRRRAPTARLVTAGGRVLDVTGQGPDLAAARARAYDAVGHISLAGHAPPHRHRGGRRGRRPATDEEHETDEGRRPDGIAQRPRQDGSRRAETLEAFGIEADVRVLSAHRNPAQVAELASSAPRGRLRRVHLRRRHGRPPRRRGRRPHHPAGGRRAALGRRASTASTRSTPPCRCPRASRWPPSPSTAR